MKIRNTTDFDTAALRKLIRDVVNNVAEIFIEIGHPNRKDPDVTWDALRIRGRRARILAHCDIWIRQWRPEKSEPLRGIARGSSGRAWPDGSKMRLTIESGDPLSFVWLVRHEVWHLYDVHHPRFPDAVMHENKAALEAVREQYGRAIAKVVNQWGQLPLKAPAPSAADKVARRERLKEKRIVALQARQARWESKLKRAKTALKKIQTSLRRYEQLAAAKKR